MDRLGQFSSPLLGSFSLPSLAEGSEAISEAEEINEVSGQFMYFWLFIFNIQVLLAINA